MKKNLQRFIICSLLISGVVTARPIPQDLNHPDNVLNGLSLSPAEETIDQITHTIGKINTTIDNYGYIGGYSHLGLPSGEWPRNSGHSYLAEIRYWMGATLPGGDTVLLNSVDDFQAIAMPIDGVNEYKIYLSTDSNRYFGYDVADTTGIGQGRPAFGWRVWDGTSAGYDYNTKYSTLATSFMDGGPTSEQDSHYRFNDAGSGTSLMGIEMTHSIYQWNYCYNEDFMFVVMDITNNSSNNYTDFAFGLYVDLDVGGYFGLENGRLQDMVVYDTSAGWAYTYDVIGFDPGWDANTGIMGTKFLETPNNVGMTAIRTDQWENLPEDDPGKFALITSNQYDTPLPPTDQFYIQCMNGINLTSGSTVRLVYALVAGEDSADFVQNCENAQTIYDAFYVGPEPPVTPTLRVKSGDEKVYLYWNDTSESSLDPLSQEYDFAGYKLFRSLDLGKTWGKVDYKSGNNCLEFDYQAMATYRVMNVGDPIPHSYIDQNLHNGVEYWYCLAAFDTGDSLNNGYPLQSGFGNADEVSNVVRVTPKHNPAGYIEAAATVEHLYSGNGEPSDGEVFPIVFDPEQLMDGDYKVVFEDVYDTTFWHLINETHDDTVLAYQTLMNSEEPGLFEISGGLRVVVSDGAQVPKSMSQTAGVENLVIQSDYGLGLPNFGYPQDPAYGHQHLRSNYELRYTGDSTLSAWVLDGYYGSDYPYWVPFEVWNTTTNQRISLAVYDWDNDDIWQPFDLLVIVDYPYDSTQSVASASFPDSYTWMFGFDDSLYNPQIGDIFTIEGAPLNGPDDEFRFKLDGVNGAAAGKALKNIKVVPNPYFVSYEPRVERSYDYHTALHFINLPDACTIRIYTLAGDLVKTIDHSENAGEAVWNLLSKSGQQVASGVYLYHVDSEYGEFLGRFSVIK